MNYLGRPIFPFAIDWDEAVSRSIQYDLREMSVGFGPEYFTPLQTCTVNAWDFQILLETGTDILAFEAFADSVVGRLQGFWLPCPLQAAQFVAGVSTTQFDIVAEDLASTWNTRLDQHLLLTYPDGSQRCCQIAAVELFSAVERVTLAAALAEIPPVGTIIERLHYVRFGSDNEELEFLCENTAQAKLSVVELPLEYTNAATGLQPIYLFHLWAQTPVNQHWRYTSFAAPVVSGGKLYSPFPMSQGAIKQTVDGNSATVDITAKPDGSHPFSMLANLPPGKTLWCEIFLCYLATPDTQTKIFSGFVETVEDNGTHYIAHCLDRLAWLKTKLPRYIIGTTCNHILFAGGTCKLLRQFWETTVTLSQFVAGPQPVIGCTFNYNLNLASYRSEDWFKGGILETGVGVQYEIRSILASHWNGTQLLLTLNAPLNFTPVGRTWIQITTGCDHISSTCQNKFNNFLNFGGFVAVPDRNLSLKGLNTSVSQGNKK